MKRDGILHAELARALAALRHTDTFVIADAGLPIPAGVTCIDLGYSYGQPSFVDVSATVLAISTTWDCNHSTSNMGLQETGD
ncbi:MAG: RbsD/FucU domain-containing protein [Sciscionella sp.]